MSGLPTPFYQTERATVYCADCLDILPLLQPADLVLSDPPYCSGGQFRGDRMKDVRTKYQNTGVIKKYLGFTGDNRDQRQFMAWMTIVLRSVNAVNGGLIAMFIDWRQLAALWDVFGFAEIVTQGIAVWDKTEGVRPQLGRPRQQAEFIVWGSRGKRTVKGACCPGVWRENLCGSSRVHMTQKPEKIAHDFARLMPESGTVVDPFMGSGSFGVGVLRAGRKFIGIEVSPDNCAIAAERLAKEEARLT